jgi:hypothetical protein
LSKHKKGVTVRTVILTALVASALMAATDFSSMSTQEMMGMRGTVDPSERGAFQQEMQSRMQSMTPEERAQYSMGQGKAKGVRDGSGTGSMGTGGMGAGGQGNGGGGKR